VVRASLSNFSGDLHEFLANYITSINCEQLKRMTYTLVKDRRSKKVNTLFAELRSRLTAKSIKDKMEEIGYAIPVALDSWPCTQCKVIKTFQNPDLYNWQEFIDLRAERNRQYYMCVPGYHHDECFC